MTARLVKRSFTLNRHRTSVALEPDFWAALDALARARGMALSAMVAQADAARDPATGLAALLRTDALRAARRGELGL